MKSEIRNPLDEFEDNIGYKFNDRILLKTALTHSSYANESKKKIQYNERIEFLGDSVLNLVIAEHLYSNYPDLSEGSLAKTRASVVSETSLADVAGKIDIGRFLLLGKGEQGTGGRTRSSILADAVESIIGAVYLDGGYTEAKELVLKFLNLAIVDVLRGRRYRDYKTDLQEILQKNSVEEIRYEIVGEKGPDHDKKFVSQVFHGSRIIGRGSGKSKKEAEQQAAYAALKDYNA